MRTLRFKFSHWQNWLAIFLVAAFVFIAVAAPLLSPNDPKNPGTVKIVRQVDDSGEFFPRPPRKSNTPAIRLKDPALIFDPQPPSKSAPLGTLPHMVSVWHALVWGTRSALVFGLTVAVLVALLGVVIGASSAYFGGFINSLLMRITDAFLSFPVIAGIVLIQQIVTTTLFNAGLRLFTGGLGGSFLTPSPSVIVMQMPENLPKILLLLQKINPILIAFILFSWMPYARMMNTVVLRNKQTQYVQAARALGAGHFRLIFRHLIPNSIAPVIVLAARDVGSMVLLQATFTFIGMGGESPWGMILMRGRDWIIVHGGIFTYWWVFLPATLALVLFGIGWNLLGDGLNDRLNPRTQ